MLGTSATSGELALLGVGRAPELATVRPVLALLGRVSRSGWVVGMGDRPCACAIRSRAFDGALRSAEWDSPDGREHEEVCVLARRVELLGPAPAWVHGPAGEIHDRGPLTLADGSCAVGFSEDVWI
jgi:hypothetical protein